MVAASRTSRNGRYVARSFANGKTAAPPTDRQDRVCLSALQCSAPDDIPAVRIMPISFAQSNHHDVRVKLSSYGHIWSAISTFYLCIVRPRLAQLRAFQRVPATPHRSSTWCSRTGSVCRQAAATLRSAMGASLVSARPAG